MPQASAASAGAQRPSLRVKVQKFGNFLSGRAMPNIGAIIAWGLIMALFIQGGWIQNAHLAKLVEPMIIYLLPLLIGYTGGRVVYSVGGGARGIPRPKVISEL